jgi:AcrR family transcriptional regulator
MASPLASTQAPRERLSAEERREQILVAALAEFAVNGFDGGSTDAIARSVGISQPYLFRLYRTKRELFIAATERCFEETSLMFEAASQGLQGEEALDAIGTAYVTSITADPIKLRAQLQAYAACSDSEIRAVVSRRFGELVANIEAIPGVSAEKVTDFFARGMLLNVIAATGAFDAGHDWAKRLVEPCLADVMPPAKSRA